MGFHVTSARDPESSPEYFFNHAGKPSWCGRSVDQLSGAQFLQMLTFCREEGHNQGWNDSWNERTGDVFAGAESCCMFHTDFAGGFPHHLWFESYAQGHEAAMEEKADKYPVRAGSIAELEAAFATLRGRHVDVLYKVHGALRDESLWVSFDGSITEMYARVGRARVVFSPDGQLNGTFLAEALDAGLVHLRPRDMGNEKPCLRCHYNSRNLGGPLGKDVCWRAGTKPAAGDDELAVDEARAQGMPCGPEGTFFEDNDEVLPSWEETDRDS